MELFGKRIIIISIFIILCSIVDFFDDPIIHLFNLEDEGTFELIMDFTSPIIEVFLMFWALLTGKKIISQLHDEEEQYKRLVQLSPEAIIIHLAGKVLYINESGAKLLGSNSTNELINRELIDFIHPDSKDFIKIYKEQLDKSPHSRFNQHAKIKRIDGAIIDLAFTSTAVEFKGKSARELIARDVTMQKSEVDNVRRLAYQDALTGLPNRRAFMDQLTELVKPSDKDKLKFGLLFIDLDGFKQVNDSIGHEGGDILLKLVGEYFQKCAAGKGTVARLAGDEFIVLLQNAGHDECSKVAQKMIESLSSPFIINGKRVQVTPSIGIAIFPEHSQDATELIKNADIAMYQAKQHGKNNYQIYQS